MSFKSQATKEAQAKINKEKGNTEMKDKSTIRTIITVAITLVSVAALVAAFNAGINYEKGINNDVKAQVKELSAITLKPNQQ